VGSKRNTEERWSR